MSENSIKQIQQMKKVVNHCHADGSVRVKTVQELSSKEGRKVTKEQLGVGEECGSLGEYLEKFDLPGKVMQTRENLSRIFYEIFEDLAKQNVVYAEVRYAPSKHLEQGLGYNEVVEASIDGMKKAEKEFGIKGNLILCAMRGAEKEENEKTVDVAKEYLNKGVCAVDLAGGEAIFPTKDYEYVFSRARKNGIPYTIHAGEADGIYSMQDALKFGARRIGHGVAIANYFNCLKRLELVRTVAELRLIPELHVYSEIKELLKLDDRANISSQIQDIIKTFNGVVEEIKRKNIGLEVCPKSNYDTKAFGERTKLQDYYKAVELLYKKGFELTVNPDNSTVSSIDINTELENLHKYTDLTLDDLAKIQMSGISQSFVTFEKQKDMRLPESPDFK